MCLIHKAAATTWLRILSVLSEKPGASELLNITGRNEVPFKIHKYIVRLATFNASERLRYLEDNYKITIAREPLVRFVSGYREKMKTEPSLRKKINRLFPRKVSNRLAKLHCFTRCLRKMILVK